MDANLRRKTGTYFNKFLEGFGSQQLIISWEMCMLTIEQRGKYVRCKLS